MGRVLRWGCKEVSFAWIFASARGILLLTIFFLVRADGQTQSTTYSFRTAQITPGTRLQCSGTANRCLAVSGPVLR